MIRMHEATPDVIDQEGAVVPGGAAYLHDLERRLAPYVERAEPRQRAMAYLRGLLSPTERKTSWQLVEVSGEATPYAFPYLLRRALWDPEALRDVLRRYLMQHLGEPAAVLVLDERGFLEKGRPSAGGARQYRGTAGKVDNGQLGVLLGSASPRGHALVDRELSLSEEWTADRERCQQAGIPTARRFATKPQLAQQMLARAFAAGIPATWITGDSVYGNDRRLRLWLEAQATGLCAGGLGPGIRLGARAAAAGEKPLGHPAGGRLDAPQCPGDGAKEPRWYNGR